MASRLHCERWISLFSGAPNVASHLTIITGTNGGVSSRALNGQKSASVPDEAHGAFAALLNEKPTETTPAARKSGDKVESEFEKLARLAAGGDNAENKDAIAAAIDVQPEQAIPVDPAPVLDLVEALSELKAGLDRGELLEPDMVERIDAALANLADALGIDLANLPVPDDFAALLDGAESKENGLTDMLGQILAQVTDTSTTDPASQVAAQDQLKAIGDKLAALMAALEQGTATEDKLAAIGMKPGAAPAEEIEAALNRLAALLKPEAEVPEEPVLAAPALKTNETVLTGKNADTNAQPLAAADAVKLDGKSSDNGDRPPARDNEAPRRDTRAAAPAPAPADTANTTPTAAAATPDNGVLRIDPAAAPRVIQAGYQTSQQQLNLPQIAFELARQVQDGNTRFQIRLDPPELGKIDVRLDIDKSGQVHARLTVEKSETLDLMQRDQRALERALQQAGLDSGKTNLEFSLKQNPFAGQERNERDTNPLFGGDDAATAELDEVPPTVNLYRGSLQASGVNIIA